MNNKNKINLIIRYKIRNSQDDHLSERVREEKIARTAEKTRPERPTLVKPGVERSAAPGQPDAQTRAL
jgi:hypothetical protein